METIFTDRYIKSVHPAERKIVPYHSLPVHILMISKVRSATEKEEESDNRQTSTEDLVLLVTLNKSEPRLIKDWRQVVLEAMCESSVLVSTGAAGPVAVSPNDVVAKLPALMMAKKNTDVCLGRQLYVLIANFSKVDGLLNAPVKTAHIKDERYSYRLAHMVMIVTAE